MIGWGRAIVIAGGLVLAGPAVGAEETGEAVGAPVDAPVDSAAKPAATLVPFPIYFYTPETKSGFGAFVAYYFRPDDAPADRPSSISTIFVYTARKQISGLVEGEVYLDRGRSRLRAQVAASEFPDTFWGVGNDTPDAQEEDYTPRALLVGASFERRLGRFWFAGPVAHVAYRKIVEKEAGGLIATNAVPGVRDSRVVNAGVTVSRDSRDDSVFPRAGTYHVAELTLADAALGSDYSYMDVSLASSAYVTTFRSHVLAMRLSARSTTATPPFDLLPGLGGDVLLRGYYAGRYRDRNMLAAQLEYRFPLWRRIGLVAFAAAGQVAHDVDAFRADTFHASGGLGLRFLVSRSEGLNIRADLGSAETGSGFYLGIGEVF